MWEILTSLAAWQIVRRCLLCKYVNMPLTPPPPILSSYFFLKVHNRLEYLQQLILSLSKVSYWCMPHICHIWLVSDLLIPKQPKIASRVKTFSKVKGVENVLVVFSHDIWDEVINEAIRWQFAILWTLWQKWEWSDVWNEFRKQSTLNISWSFVQAIVYSHTATD